MSKQNDFSAVAKEAHTTGTRPAHDPPLKTWLKGAGGEREDGADLKGLTVRGG